MSELQSFSAYLAPKNFSEDLISELGKYTFKHGDLFFAMPPEKSVVWTQDVWPEVYRIPVKSITDAAKKLRALGKIWHPYSVGLHRRTALIQQQLPKIKTHSLQFPLLELSNKKVGGWTLFREDEILACPSTWKKIPLGVMEFVENKKIPPNRAYLKLWEIFTTIEETPKPGEICLDLGSSPGGWTWVLQSLGAEVVSVDKAELAASIIKLPRIRFLKNSAFALDPREVGKIDWLCCDIACYPERLYMMVEKWLEAGNCRNMICTIKLQGSTDFKMIRKFQEIPDSQVWHLYHNKHELTWIWPARKILRQK